MKITLKDGSVKEYENNMSVIDIAKDISEGLARVACAGEVDGEVVDLRTVIDKDCELNILTFDSDEGKHAFRHTASHILAQAVKRLYPETKLAIGPSIDNGFYYDMEKDTPFTQEDLEKIEKEMKKIVKENLEITSFTKPRDEAIAFMKERNEPYKVELIEDLPEDSVISFYQQGEFVDLCAGPHLMTTKPVKAFKLTSIAGAYWRGDEHNQMLTRIYGTAFTKKAELDAYLTMMEEARKRDHRKLGKELGLFMMREEGPGFPFFLPKGMVLKNTLLDYWREIHQKATSHAESWYGFYSAFIASKYFPSAGTDKAVTERFDYLFNLLHDTTRMEPLYYASRIQNTSTTIGMLIDKYEAQGSVEDLHKASMLADWMIKHWQREDGAYVNHNTIYTSVIYVAKSVLELALAEKQLDGQEWQDAAGRHYQSAKRAIDQLVESQGDFQTEGELTFEDGMISCSALQIGMLALMQKDEIQKKHYTDAMLDILNSHDCLTQLKVPDGRRRQGTMRYWEAQYDVQMLPNMFNSPHGWSGWRAYATYYAYLLTGEEKWLLQTFNAMGAFANLIDYKTGDLRWAFVVDPHLRVEQACSADTHYTADSLSFGNPHPRLYDTRKFVIGEQYVNMISDWQTVNTQDNDVHELFKCIGETVLTNAFVVERADGSVAGYNCKVIRKGNTLEVKADEKQIRNLHCNLKHAYTVRFEGQKKDFSGAYTGWAFGKSEYDF